MSYAVPDRLRAHQGYQLANCCEENVLLPLVTFEEDEIRFDEQIAKKTFANEVYHGKKISLVSVMGPSRMGKSFLMSFLTGGMKGNKISGAFQSGYERCTEGILIFVNPMISKDGSNVIFFLDTQGTFDLKTERNISAWIAGFSLLISDVQIVNLRGNIGGDDLHDLNMFVESAAAFREGSVAKSLIFVVRDAPDWKESKFLEKLWNQNEKSKEMKEIARALKNRFINGIDCVCVVPVSDRIRRANQTIELQEEDKTLIQCLERVQKLIYEKCEHESKVQLQAPIELSKKITAYLQEEAPELRPTVQMIQEATVIQAMNKAFDVFAKAIKNSTPETLPIDEAFGKAEVHRKFETLLLKKEHLIAEAHALLDPKIAEMILEKQSEFAQLKKEKEALKAAEKFAQEWRTKIHKISTLKEALDWKRNSVIEKNANSTIPSTIIDSMKEALRTKIITLKSQFIQTRLNELNNELRLYLLTTNFGNVPEEEQIKDHIKKVIEVFKIECLKNAFENVEFSTIEGEFQRTLEKTSFTCRNMLVSKKNAENKKAELEAEVAAEIQKSNYATYCDVASDLVNDRKEEHEICKSQSNGSLNVLDTFKEDGKEKESVETSLGLMSDHEPSAVAMDESITKPSKEVELNSERNKGHDVPRIGKMGPRLENVQRETTVSYSNRNPVDPRSASLPINLPRPDSPEYEEISEMEMDRFISKTSEENAVREMDYKFRLLKAVVEQIDDKKEKQKQFEIIYKEYAAWCEAQIGPAVMMYFVNKFQAECALYMREYHQIDVDVRRHENEIIRRTENPKWTEAQKLKRKVLLKRKLNLGKKICDQKVRYVFSELLAEKFADVHMSGSWSSAKISALIEYSKNKRDFFLRTLGKYDKHGQLPDLLENMLVDQWMSLFYTLPHQGFEITDTFNEYQRVRRDLPLNVPHKTHITFMSDMDHWFNEQEKKREREERERRENEERRREAEILRREAWNNSWKRFSLSKLPDIFKTAPNPSETTPPSQHAPSQAITYHQPGSQSNQWVGSGQKMEEVVDRFGRTQNDFHQ